MVTDPAVGLRFYVQIEGIGHLFLDGAAPVGPDGTAWAAPTSKGFSYTLLEHTLDVRAGLRDAGAEVTRVTAQVTSASLNLLLRDTESDDLLRLFAGELEGGDTAELTEDIAWGSGGSLLVTSTSAWPSSGFVYHDRETIAYGAKLSAVQFGTLTRDVFSLGFSDRAHWQQEAIPATSKEVASYPRVWHGRYVRVFAFLVDAAGRAFDAAFGATYSQEIWRGTLQGDPLPTEDWLSWSLRTVSIEAVLKTEVGREYARGTLLRVAADRHANQAGAATAPDGSPEGTVTAFVRRVEAYVHLRVTEWASEADYEADTSPTVYDYTGDSAIEITEVLWGFFGTPAGVLTTDQITQAWADTVRAQLISDGADTQVALWRRHGKWVITSTCYTSRVAVVTIDWSPPNSIGALIGFSGTLQHTCIMGKGQGWTGGGVGLAAIIRDTSTSIPLFFGESSALGTDLPTAPGYAILGEDDTLEVVKYSTLSALAATNVAGLYLLEGCERGRMGTVAREHRIEVQSGGAVGEEVSVRFGVGWEDTPFLQILLELATSTGNGHHGDYDVLGERVCVPLDPSHFDTARFEAVMEALLPSESRVTYLLLEAQELSELAQKWLQPMGLYLHAAAGTSGLYQITVSEVLPALESEAVQAIGPGQLQFDTPLRFEPANDRVVNAVVAHYRWDPVDAEPVKGATVTVYSPDGGLGYGERHRIEWTLVGYQLDGGTALERVTGWAQQVFSRYGRPYGVARLSLGREGWQLRPGDALELTVPYAPTRGGTRGYVSQLVVVVQVAKAWAGPDAGADVLVVQEPAVRSSTYVPSARISAYNAGTPSITLELNAFSAEGFDSDHFDVDDVVWIYETEGDVSSRVQRTLISHPGTHIFYLSSALGFTPDSDSLVVGADYDAVQGSQRRHVHIAENGATAIDGDTPFRYV